MNRNGYGGIPSGLQIRFGTLGRQRRGMLARAVEAKFLAKHADLETEGGSQCVVCHLH